MDNKNLFDRDSYIPDPADYEVRRIRDLIDLDTQDFLHDDDIDVVEDFLMEYKYHCEDLVNDLMGVNSDYECNIGLNLEQLRFIDEKYSSQSFEKDEYGEIVLRDTLYGWIPKFRVIGRVLFDAGHVLGLKGDLGKYYRLLANERFAHVVWHGRLENAVSVNDKNIFEDVYTEMKVLRPRTYQSDFDNLINGLFTDSVDNNLGDVKGLK